MYRKPRIKFALNSAEMKSLRSFLIVALAVATSLLPSVHAQEDCEEGCLNCKSMNECGSLQSTSPAADEACIVDQGLALYVTHTMSPCNCGGGSTGCDPYDDTKKISCENGMLSVEDCPDGERCSSGVCVVPTPIITTTQPTTTTTTTKPATCSADNGNTRYPHETDCKKFYLCLQIIFVHLYVELTCSGSLVYNKVTAYCDLPENVPDCQQ